MAGFLERLWQQLSLVWGIATISSYWVWRRIFPVETINRPTIPVLVLGLKGVGKSTILAILTKEFHSETLPPTNGFAIKAVETPSCIISATEIGGSSKLRSHWHRYYHQAYGLIVVVSDSADIDEQLTLLKELLSDQRIVGPRLILLKQQQIGNTKFSQLCDGVENVVQNTSLSSPPFPVIHQVIDGQNFQPSLDNAMKKFGDLLSSTIDPVQSS
eukprot:gene8994-1324_t